MRVSEGAYHLLKIDETTDECFIPLVKEEGICGAEWTLKCLHSTQRLVSVSRWPTYLS